MPEPGTDTFPYPPAPASNGEWVLGFLAGAVPVVAVLAFDPAGWFPFGVIAWWAVAVTVLAAGAAALFAGRPHAPVRPWPSRAVGSALAALVALTALSAAVALDGLTAWIGTSVRHLGVAAWVVFGVALLTGRTIGASSVARSSFVRGIVLAALALGVWCAVEIVFGNPVDAVSDTARLVGPFGSAAYLGAACCLVGPVAASVAIDASQPRRWRVVAGVAAALTLVAVVGSGSRAAILGLVAAAMLVTAAVPRGSRRRDRNLAIAGAAAIGLVLTAAVAVRAGVFGRSYGPASRFDEWRIAVRAIGERPLLGTGPEGYRLVVGMHVDDDYVRRYGEAVGVDRAHSGLLDVAVASGVMAALTYAVVGIAVVWCAAALMRRRDPTDVGIAAAAVAAFVQQQFLFPVAEIDPILWLVVGMMTARLDRATLRAWPSALLPRLGAAALAVVAAITAIVGVHAVAADRLARQATRAGDAESAVDLAERAVDLAPFDVRLHVLAARAQEGRRSLAGVDAALDAIDRATAVAPRDPVVVQERARLLALRAAITGADDDRRAADDAWELAIDAAPRCVRCRLAAADAAIDRGDVLTARRHLTVAVQLGDDDAAVRLEQLPTG